MNKSECVDWLVLSAFKEAGITDNPRNRTVDDFFLFMEEDGDNSLSVVDNMKLFFGNEEEWGFENRRARARLAKAKKEKAHSAIKKMLGIN